MLRASQPAPADQTRGFPDKPDAGRIAWNANRTLALAFRIFQLAAFRILGRAVQRPQARRALVFGQPALGCSARADAYGRAIRLRLDLLHATAGAALECPLAFDLDGHGLGPAMAEALPDLAG